MRLTWSVQLVGGGRVVGGAEDRRRRRQAGVQEGGHRQPEQPPHFFSTSPLHSLTSLARHGFRAHTDVFGNFSPQSQSHPTFSSASGNLRETRGKSLTRRARRRAPSSGVAGVARPRPLHGRQREEAQQQQQQRFRRRSLRH